MYVHVCLQCLSAELITRLSVQHFCPVLLLRSGSHCDIGGRLSDKRELMCLHVSGHAKHKTSMVGCASCGLQVGDPAGEAEMQNVGDLILCS
jgi:hypothetical protein